MVWTPSFNKSVGVEARDERITGDSGAVSGREVLCRSRIVRWMGGRLSDARDPGRVRHPLASLLRTAMLLVAQGRRDHNDAAVFGDDPAFRLAVSGRAGTTPPGGRGALASQPTLSRLVSALSGKRNMGVLRAGLARFAGWRLRAMNGGRLPKRLVIDIDSLPVEVHGAQPGSEWNGHYHARIYHPLIASVGETGDLVDARLRNGRVHTADGGLDFITEVLERAERHLCKKPLVRFDAGYPGEALMSALEARGTHFVARIRNNAVLKRLAVPAIDALAYEALDRLEDSDRCATWSCELDEEYRAGSWSRGRRVVRILVERPGELFPRSFRLITSLPAGEMSAGALLAMYRQRGKAENHMGLSVSVVAPALSSSPRPKSHYRGRPVRKRAPGADAFANNEARLLLALFGYQIMHTQRAVLERATGTGWGLRRVLERVLRAPARFTVSGRRITMITGAGTPHWHMLLRHLDHLAEPAG